MKQVFPEDRENKTKEVTTAEQKKAMVTSISSAKVEQNKEVLLATAIVKVINNENKEVLCRALLDSSVQSCFITSKCAKRLTFKQISTKSPVFGIGAVASQTITVKMTVQSRINNFKINLEFLVMDSITPPIPFE